MRIRRCPLLCHDRGCQTCGGGGYLKSDGSPATPEEMLEQLTKTLHVRPKRLKFGKPSRFS